jgi:flagellar biosynthesis GTPase FlhF
MTPVQTLGQSLNHWQALYIVAITLALLSTFAIVFFAFHKEHRTGLRTSNYIYVVASLLAVISTIVIVNKTKSLDDEKDRVSKANGDASDLKVAQANSAAEQAKKDAATANENALRVSQQNIKLSGQISTDAATSRSAEQALAKANKETSDFAHSLEQQQATMAEQAKVSPVLTPFQQQQLANVLRPFSGQEIIIHQTAETVVGRLGSTIAGALNAAGLKFPQYSTDMGALYQGVSVAVHDPHKVPPLANALVMGLRQAGIDVRPVAAPQQVPEGKVAIYLGPN